MLTLDEDYEIKIPTRLEDNLASIEFNISKLFVHQSSGAKVNVVAPDPEYEQFLADVWVGIVLTLMVLSCVCFMCSCLIYHKFQQWKSRVMEARNAANIESTISESELPSYTLASGLPSYEEALEQLKKVKDPIYVPKTSDWTPHTPPTPVSLSVVNLFSPYKGQLGTDVVTVKPS